MSVLRYYYLILRRNYIFGKKLAPLGRRKETKRKNTKEMDWTGVKGYESFGTEKGECRDSKNGWRMRVTTVI